MSNNKPSEKIPVWPGPVLFALSLAFYYAGLIIHYSGGEYLAYGTTYITNLIGAGTVRSDIDRLFHLTYYPPVYYLFITVCRWLLGLNFVRFIFANTLFVAGGLLYLYGIARLLGDRLAPSLPGILLVMLPGLTIASQTLTIEQPLLLLGPGLVYHILASQNFRRPGHCAAAGLMLGLGMLTKWSFPAYVAGFLVLYAIGGLLPAGGKKGFLRDRSALRNSTLFIGVALVTCLPWYLLRMEWDTFFLSAQNDPNFPTYDYFRNVSAYLDFLLIYIGKAPALVMAALAVWSLAFGNNRLRLLACVLAFVLLPVLIFAIPVHLEMRYLSPMLPAVAFIGYLAAMDLRPRALRPVAAIALAAVLCLAHFQALESQASQSEDSIGDSLGVPAGSELLVRYLGRLMQSPKFNTGLVVSWHPLWNNYHIHCEYLHYHTRDSQLYKRLKIHCHTKPFYGDFRQTLLENGYDVILMDGQPREDLFARDREEMEAFADLIGRQGYVNQMAGDRATAFTIEDIRQDLRPIRDNYVPILVLSLSDGTHTTVWAHRRLSGRLYPERFESKWLEEKMRLRSGAWATP